MTYIHRYWLRFVMFCFCNIELGTWRKSGAQIITRNANIIICAKVNVINFFLAINCCFDIASGSPISRYLQAFSSIRLFFYLFFSGERLNTNVYSWELVCTQEWIIRMLKKCANIWEEACDNHTHTLTRENAQMTLEPSSKYWIIKLDVLICRLFSTQISRFISHGRQYLLMKFICLLYICHATQILILQHIFSLSLLGESMSITSSSFIAFS